ncbi:MAG: chemotaxis protein CheD [Clostridiales bacterium]|nr:chemotaxis protein CheD [Clostridiales bacterium]
MKLCRAPGVLVTYALGSCIGICLYDNVIKLAAMVHIMLPAAQITTKDNNVYKFADTGIPEAIKKMIAFGAVKSRITCKIAGGAKMFETFNNSEWGNIGERNAKSVREVLRREGIKLLKEDVGSNYARTLYFDSSTGIGTVKAFGKPEYKL